MKRICALLSVVIMLVALIAVPVSADVFSVEFVKLNAPMDFTSPIMVTEFFPNPSGSKDYFDFMEIVNVSPADIDLYDFMFWGKGADTVPTMESVNRHNYFTNTRGELILKPGQIAVCFIITADHFKAGYCTVNAEGKADVDREKFISGFKSMYGENAVKLDDALVVFMDRTKDGANNANGTGYANKVYNTYWITRRIERSETTTAAGDLTEDIVVAWFDANNSNSEDVSFLYTWPQAGSKKLEYTSTKYMPTAGYISDEQYADLTGTTPETTPEVTTEKAPDTTPEEVTTEKPNDDTTPTVVTTEKPNDETTPAPVTTPNVTDPGTTEPESPNTGSCGSLSLMLSVCMGSAAFFGVVMVSVIKRRK